MAFMNQERKKGLAPRIKSICKKHGVKATLAVRNYSTLVLNISSGSIDFGSENQVNRYKYQEFMADYKEAVNFLDEVLPAMNVGNHNRSDLMTDYFDVGWYVDINIGRYNKPYVQT